MNLQIWQKSEIDLNLRQKIRKNQTLRQNISKTVKLFNLLKKL